MQNSKSGGASVGFMVASLASGLTKEAFMLVVTVGGGATWLALGSDLDSFDAFINPAGVEFSLPSSTSLGG